MRIHIAASAAVLGLLALLTAPLAPAASVKPDVRTIDAVVANAMKAFQVPGCAVAIAKGDEVILAKGYGTREHGKSQPVSADTLFPIASTSKAFTATAIAMLVEEGKLNWDDPVRKHLDYFRLSDPLASENATIRDLTCHRTGLSRHDLLWYNSPWKREEIVRRVGKVKLTQPYRQMFQYQNIMYAAAGETIKQASGQNWEEFVAKRIFQPLGMKQANCSAAEAEKSRDHARPHLRKDGGKLVALEQWRNLDNCAPAGAINAGVRELIPWVRFNLGDGMFNDKRLLSEKRLKELHSPQTVVDMEGPTGVPSFSKDANPETNVMTYGLGWVIQDYRGEHMVSHGGAIDGFRAQIALLPKHKLGIIILANLGRNSMPEALRNTLIDYLLGLEKKDWNAHYLDFGKKLEAKIDEQRDKQDRERAKDTKPTHPLAAYAGNYDEPAYGRAVVAVDAEVLLLRWSNFSVRLEHWHHDTFMIADPKIDRDSPLFRQMAAFTLSAADGKPAVLSFLGQDFARAAEGK